MQTITTGAKDISHSAQGAQLLIHGADSQPLDKQATPFPIHAAATSIIRQQHANHQAASARLCDHRPHLVAFCCLIEQAGRLAAQGLQACVAVLGSVQGCLEHAQSRGAVTQDLAAPAQPQPRMLWCSGPSQAL